MVQVVGVSVLMYISCYTAEALHTANTLFSRREDLRKILFILSDFNLPDVNRVTEHLSAIKEASNGTLEVYGVGIGRLFDENSMRRLFGPDNCNSKHLAEWNLTEFVNRKGTTLCKT